MRMERRIKGLKGPFDRDATEHDKKLLVYLPLIGFDTMELLLELVVFIAEFGVGFPLVLQELDQLVLPDDDGLWTLIPGLLPLMIAAVDVVLSSTTFYLPLESLVRGDELKTRHTTREDV